MKIYSGNSIYRGCSYDFKLCSTSLAKVAKILDITTYEVNNYINVGPKIKPEDEFEGIIITPYGSRTSEVLELTSENLRDKMTLEEFKSKVDELNPKYWAKQLK